MRGPALLPRSPPQRWGVAGTEVSLCRPPASAPGSPWEREECSRSHGRPRLVVRGVAGPGLELSAPAGALRRWEPLPRPPRAVPCGEGGARQVRVLCGLHGCVYASDPSSPSCSPGGLGTEQTSASGRRRMLSSRLPLRGGSSGHFFSRRETSAVLGSFLRLSWAPPIRCSGLADDTTVCTHLHGRCFRVLLRTCLERAPQPHSHLHAPGSPSWCWRFQPSPFLGC